MLVHNFVTDCTDFSTILSNPNLSHMLKVVDKQSKSIDVKMKMDFVNYIKYKDTDLCPQYIGSFGEWLGCKWLNYFGYLFNVHAVEMLDSAGNNEKDLGVDGKGLTIKQAKFSGGRIARMGSPVFIQVKTTHNPTKTFYANDETRLPNFGMHAMASAITSGHSYDARYIIWTTGNNIYHTLNSMSCGLFEVINHTKISGLMDGNIDFLNHLRISVNLEPIPMPLASPDPEWIALQDERKNLSE